MFPQPIPPDSPVRSWTAPIVLGALGIGVIIPLILYVVLPMLGMQSLSYLFSLNKIGLLVALIIGGLLYTRFYLRFMTARPQWLVYFILVGWPVLEGINNFLLENGVNLHERPLLLLAIGGPLLMAGKRFAKPLLTHLPHLKGWLAFFALVFAYFLFYNAMAADPKLGIDSIWSEGSVGFSQLSSYLFILFGIMAAGVAMLNNREPDKLFDRFNRILMAGTALVALLPIGGFPFGMFCQNIDGFLRANGLYAHPNPYAHHMGLLMVYLVGLLCYYQSEAQNNLDNQPDKNRMPAWLLYGSLGLNAIAFLLGLSKTSFGVFGLCAALIFILNLSSPVLRRRLGKILIAVMVLIPIGLVAFQLVTGKGLMQIMEARGEQNTSMEWRSEIWGQLLASMTPESLLFGHGFTSANMLVFQLTYNTLKNATPLILVHNGYLSLLYDFGIPGLLLFAVALWTGWWAVRRLRLPQLAPVRPLIVTMLAMVVYFLFASGFDEMIYMFDAPLLFWTLTTLIVCRVWACHANSYPEGVSSV